MGLALYSSADALDLTQRYLSPGPSQVSRPRPRAHYNGAYYHPDGSIALNRELAGHKLPLLDLILITNHEKRAQRQRHTRLRQTHRSARQWHAHEAAEGRTLAQSRHHSLPGDQRRRTPSLERQEAFRDSRTTKARTCLDQDARDVQELYRMGILYDDEHLRGPGFGLDAIARPEAEYTMRPAKQTRKSKASNKIPYDDDVQLALDFSLAELGRDESFVRYLCSPDLDEAPSDHDNDDDDDDDSTESLDSARLAPLYFVSELVDSPDYFGNNTNNTNTPELTSDSDSDPASFSYSDDESWSANHSGWEEKEQRGQ